MPTMEQIQELRALIKKANDAYYLDQDPIMSDQEYDMLVKQLTSLEEKYPDFVNQDSPSQQVGGGVSSLFTKIEHASKMLSLDNIYSRDEFDKYVDVLKSYGIDPVAAVFYADMKLDGLSLSLRYEYGGLTSAATRGDGTVGEDVTENVLDLVGKGLVVHSSKIPYDFMEARGECTISKENFTKVNQMLIDSNEKPMASPRHMAAAFIRTLKKNRPFPVDGILEFNVYGMDDMTPENPYGWLTHSAMILSLLDMGFQHPFGRTFKGMEKVWTYYTEVRDARGMNPIEIDGIVFRLNSFKDQAKMGITSKYPKYAMAIKFPAEAGSSVVKSIDFQIGRTGVLTPVLTVDPPIRLGGVSVARATLHNVSFVESMDLRIGDIVQIERSGDVIPKVVRNDKTRRDSKSRPFASPEKCPVCNSRTRRRSDQIYCTNTTCPGTVKALLAYVVSRACFNVVGVGPMLTDHLYDTGLVRTPLDLFRLKPGQMSVTPEREARILAAFDQVKNSATLAQIILSLNINEVGTTTAKLLERTYPSLSHLRAATYEELMKIPTIGNVVAESIVLYFKEHPGIDREYAAVGFKMDNQATPIEVDTSSIYYGKRVCVSGTFDVSREQLLDRLARAGAIISSIQTADIFLQGKNPSPKKKKIADERRIVTIKIF